jgi:hypothetical protein
MSKSISYLSDEVTLKTNTQDALTPILELSPETGNLFRIKNHVSIGSSSGLALIMDLNDSNGNDLPTDAKVILRVERPQDDAPQAVSVAEYHISPWNQLTTKQQRDTEFIDQVKINLKSQNVNVRDKDTLTIDVETTEQIDWSQSELYFLRESIDELPLRD